jgi:hypothetical protein
MQHGVFKGIFWVCFILAATILAAMALYTFPTISAAAGGLTPFDLRPFGYSLEETKVFLTALTPEGRDFYLNTQHRLDTPYPILIAVSLALGGFLIAPSSPAVMRWLTTSVALPGAVFDYRENFLVTRLLKSNLESLDPDLAAAASFATLVKSLCNALAITLVLIFAMIWIKNRWRDHGSREV